jgi:hypothetical protein
MSLQRFNANIALQIMIKNNANWNEARTCDMTKRAEQ